MKAFIAACIAIVIIAVGAVYALSHFQEPVQEAFSSPTSVRI
jgi:hypothetical protein